MPQEVSPGIHYAKEESSKKSNDFLARCITCAYTTEEHQISCQWRNDAYTFCHRDFRAISEVTYACNMSADDPTPTMG